MHLNIIDIFYSQCSHQHVSARILAIFRVTLLFQEYKFTNLVNCHHHYIAIEIIISDKIMHVSIQI